MLDRPRMHGNDPYTVSFPADAGAVAAAVAAAIRFGHAAGLPLDTHAKLAVIVEELVGNIVEHGDPGDSRIGMALSVDTAAVRLTITDAGTRFDPRDAVRPAVPPERGGGAGIALVLGWSRIVDYARRDGMNRIDLEIPRAV